MIDALVCFITHLSHDI